MKSQLVVKKRLLGVLLLSLAFICCLSIWQQDNSVHDVNWKSWIAGGSVSAEFHYFDLLELLFTLHNPE